jgi:hypothetical protein
MFLGLALALTLSADDVSAALIKDATSVKLDKFLEQYIGECQKGDAEDKIACKDIAEKFRKEANKKTYVVEVPSTIARTLRPVESKDPNFYSYLFTPFFDGGGYGLTFGKPLGQEKNGNPKIKPAVFNIPSSDEGQAILDGFKVDRVTIQLVFKPQDIWKLKQGKEIVYGVAVQPVLLRMEEGRSGASATTVF